MPPRRRYPIGIQTFSEIRTKGYLYADKTEHVYNLAQGDAKYIFLSRPRRFGKSLLLSTLKSYFEGRRDLFEGLAIDHLETEWKEYPVLHFSMASGKHLGKEQLENYLNYQLEDNERKIGMPHTRSGANNRLDELIKYAYQQTGRQVVVLIDEYDAPLLDVIHEEENLPTLRNVMRNFYSPLKDCDPYLRFVFLTGITKFSQLSIFSELNNILNISMLPRYADICGFTREELTTYFDEGICELAEKENITHDEALKSLTKMYDGYHFTWPSPDLFNPFSILNAFYNNDLGAYWFGSGTPTYLIEMMQKFHFSPTMLRPTNAMVQDFDAPTQTMTSIIPLLYQSGYFTIKGYDQRFGRYLLDMPNTEVRLGLIGSLIPNYITRDTLTTNNTIVDMAMYLYKDDIEGTLRLLQTFLSTVPYCDNTNYEGHWQQVLFIIFSLLGNYCDVEVHTATGRVDFVMATPTRLYIVETKLKDSASAALQQINLKEYDKRFALYNLPVTKVGIRFDDTRRTLADWVIEEA